jgi:outer membrane protein TolC
MILKNFTRSTLILLGLLFFFQEGQGQQILTLESALGIAQTNSPDIRKSLLSLTRSEELLKAQKAALKSSFSLNLTPFSYNMSRSFNDYYSTWYTTKNTESYGTFTVSQPILPTDGTISLINRFGWQNNFSEINESRNKTFSNYLYLSLNQPLFTYNKTKLQLKETGARPGKCQPELCHAEAEPGKNGYTVLLQRVSQPDEFEYRQRRTGQYTEEL